MNEERRETQEEFGMVENFSWSALNLILADGYPSWTWVIGALGGQNIVTCMKGLSVEERM